MRPISSLISAVVAAASLAACGDGVERVPEARCAYPATPTAHVGHDDHGTRVPDSCRWLEDDDPAETRAWIEAQNRLTEGYPSGMAARTAIRVETWVGHGAGLPVSKRIDEATDQFRLPVAALGLLVPRR